MIRTVLSWVRLVNTKLQKKQTILYIRFRLGSTQVPASPCGVSNNSQSELYLMLSAMIPILNLNPFCLNFYAHPKDTLFIPHTHRCRHHIFNMVKFLFVSIKFMNPILQIDSLIYKILCCNL